MVPDMKDFNQQLIAEFRANVGRLTGPFADVPLLLLTTAGAKSGQPRTNPLNYTRYGDRLVILASKSGGQTNPDWYHNLVAHPEATVELPGETFHVRATIQEGAERERLFKAMAAQIPVYQEFQRQTTRQIPVVVLERTS